MLDYNSAVYDWSNVLGFLVHHKLHCTSVLPCPDAITLSLSIIAGASAVRAVSFGEILCIFKKSSLDENSVSSGLLLPESVCLIGTECLNRADSTFVFKVSF